jgi:predicted deacetylase
MGTARARYLLRFDDLCPTISKERFERFRAIIERHRIRPILAVVPDNRDPELEIDSPDPGFWKAMHALEAAGATIAMHGYRHVCASVAPSILGLHDCTEFAGMDEDTQRRWIRAGLAILRGQGLNPRLFVAPRHGFDRATLRALDREGLGVISDGFATRAHTRDRVIWIPQQLWEPVKKSIGLWTICIHPNTASGHLENMLDLFLIENARQFVSFDEVMNEWIPSSLNLRERLSAEFAMRRVRWRSEADRRRSRGSLQSGSGTQQV